MEKISISSIDQQLPSIPLKIHLSFKKLFEHWEERANSEHPKEAHYAKEVLEQLNKVPGLNGHIDDYSILDQYKEEVQLLLSAVFPPALGLNEIKAAGVPFTPILFNPSPRFSNILKNASDDYNLVIKNMDADSMYIFSGLFILKTLYGIEVDAKRPFFIDIPDETTGITRYYRLFINADFVDFKLLNEDFHLSKEEIQLLLDNFEDIALWREKIPVDTFELEGFTLMTIFDVTTDMVLSYLKSDLLDKNALHNQEKVNHIEQLLRILFNIKDLRFGFAFIDQEDVTISSLLNNYASSLILSDTEEICLSDAYCDHASKSFLTNHKTLAISDLEKAADVMPEYKRLTKQGIKSYIAAPILNTNDELIGLFEIGSTKTGELNSVVVNKLADILPMFSIAMQRSLDEYQTRLEVIVQDKYTAIHPSVSWRFFEAAENLLKTKQLIDTEQIEDISFEDVYPLYGQSDIKGSSTERNKAIQEDLIEQLEMAKKVLTAAAKQQAMPIFEQLKYRINKYTRNLKKGLNAGDEVSMLEFLRREVYPVFDHLKNVDETLKQKVTAYQELLDPELGVLYKKRREYEQSVSLINEKLSDYIDKQQEIAQQMYPHYFEKYKTDGVEFNIYIGDSLVKNRPFHQLHLQNLRLWQLLTIAGVENVMHQLKPTLKIPLDVASLILIHSSPLSIKFRMDEKRFDVDGAYNVRYEIIKKRIDKAYIKGTNERLTQPGKIAIVYSQNRDAEEYLQYIEYLQSIKVLGDQVERLDLQDLQGASGLRALRVNVLYKAIGEEIPSSAQLIKSN
ncbi:MAG: GAF domain-containing protein [Bacteroidota bacterium]